MTTATDSDALLRAIQSIGSVELERLRLTAATASDTLAIHGALRFQPRAVGAESAGTFDAVAADASALANTRGGDLLIGANTDAFGRIVGWQPMPRVRRAAERIAKVLAESVDPQIPRLVVRAIELGDAGAGVVLCRVPRSRIAPHRAAPGDVCYARDAGATRALSIREVQALAFATARGTANVDARLGELRRRFVIHARPISNDARDFRDSALVSAVPATPGVEIDRAWLWARRRPFAVPAALAPLFGAGAWRRWPALGGIGWRLRTPQATLRVEAFVDGSLSAWLVTTADATSSGRRRLVERQVALARALMGLADEVRAHASAPRAEYALDAHAQYAQSGRRELHPMERALPVYSVPGVEPAEHTLALLHDDLLELGLDCLIPEG